MSPYNLAEILLVCYTHRISASSINNSDLKPMGLLDQLDESLLAIRRVFLRAAFRRRLLHGLSRDVSLATVQMLRAVERSDRPPSVGDVAEALMIDPSTASRLVEAAAEMGLVKRRSCSDDRRSRRLHLTAEGQTVLEEVTARRRQLLAQVTEGWDTDELERLTSMLWRLRAAFDELERA